jgi:pimeloyl-ACP methyl ester carboxylesterase
VTPDASVARSAPPFLSLTVRDIWRHLAPRLFDHLVGGHEQARRHGQAERFRGLEVERGFELGRRLHRKIGRFVAAQDAVDIGCRLPKMLDEVDPVGHEPAGRDEYARVVDRRRAVPRRNAPSKKGDAEFLRWWGRWERLGGSPSAVKNLMRMNSEINIDNILPSVRVPSLILHRTEDPTVSIQAGRFLADTFHMQSSLNWTGAITSTGSAAMRHKLRI